MLRADMNGRGLHRILTPYAAVDRNLAFALAAQSLCRWREDERDCGYTPEAHAHCGMRSRQLQPFDPVASRCDGARVCGELGSDVVSIAHGNGVLTEAKHWPRVMGRAIRAAHANTAYAPCIHTPVATALGFLLPHIRPYIGLQNVSSTHNRLGAFNACLGSLVSPTYTRTHERRSRKRQGRGAMQSLCAER